MDLVIGKYVEGFKGADTCLVLSAKILADLVFPERYCIGYQPEDGGSVVLYEKDSERDLQLATLSGGGDVISELKSRARALVAETSPSHYFIDTADVPIVVSSNEYSWLP